MSKKNRGTLVDLKDLGQKLQHLKVTLPSLEELNLRKDFSDLDKMITEQVIMVRRIEEGVASIFDACKKGKAWLAKKEDGLERKLAARFLEESMASNEKHLKGYFEVDNEIYSVAAKKTYLLVALSEEFEGPDEATEALLDLEARGLLKKCEPQNPSAIKIGYQSFAIDIKLDVDEKKEVAEPIAAFSKLILQMRNQQRQQDQREMSASADISLDDLLDGKSGTCVVKIPAESYEKDGREMWRGGGHLQVTSDGRIVRPVKGVGSLEGAIASMQETGVSLTLKMVENDKVPDFFKLKDHVVTKMGFSEEDATKHANRQRALWYLFDRAIRELQVKKDTADAKEKFKNDSKASPAQFFGLETHSQEPTLLEFAGVFKLNGHISIHNPFFLAKNLGEELEVLDVAPHAEDLLGKYVGKKFPTEDTFRKCPPALGRVLRAILGQTDMAKTTAITAITADE